MLQVARAIFLCLSQISNNRESYWTGRISTVDLLVLTSSFYCSKIFFLFYKRIYLNVKNSLSLERFLPGRNVGQVFSSRSVCLHAIQLHCFGTKLPSLKLKTRQTTSRFYYERCRTRRLVLLSCRIFTHLATLLHLAMLQWLRAQTLAPPTPFPLWPLGHKKSRSLSGLPLLLIYQDIHWCLHQRTVYIVYVLQISRALLWC